MGATVPDEIPYPEIGTNLTPLATHFAALAQGAQEAIDAVRASTSPPVNSDAERFALYPTPVQGNTVLRRDKGYTEAFFSEYSLTGNPGGATPAGWYPIAGALPFGRLIRGATAFTIPSGSYSNISANNYWTEQTRRNMPAFNAGWTIPITGIYNITATFSANGGSSMLAGFAPDGLTITSPPMMEGQSVSGALQLWTAPTPNLTRKFNAGDKICLWALAGTANAIWNLDSRGSTWSIQYVAPPVN